MIGCGLQGHFIGQMLDAEILELNFHRGADVDLHSEHAFERATFFIEVDEIGGGMTVDPMLVMIAAHKHTKVLPFVRRKFFHFHGAGDPGLAIGRDDDFLAGVREDAASAFFVEHAVVVRRVGDDVALVAIDDVEADFGSHLAAVLEAAIAAGADFYFHLQVEVADR